VILALLLAAAAPANPPAHVVVPKSMQRDRSAEDLALPASIFDDPQLAEALGPLKPQTGAWVEYAIHNKKQGGVRARFSILPPALPDGRYWLEINAISEDVPPSSVKLLVHGSPLVQKDIERAFVMVAGQAPIELPVDQMPAAAKPAAAKGSVKLHRGPAQAVTVPAGTFAGAETLRAGDTRIWRSGRVPLWGLVKAQSSEHLLELTASGATGAHSMFPAGWGDPVQGKGSESTK